MYSTWNHLQKRLTRLFRGSSKPSRSAPRRARLGVESLERRDLLSGMAGVVLTSSYMPNPTILAMARADYVQHGAINFNDMLSIFSQVQRSGSISSSEMISLDSLASYGGYLNMPTYVQTLSLKTVYGDPANARFGNLHTGSSPAQLGEVAGQWFLGNALPALVSGEGYYQNYYDPSGNVFGGWLSYTEVSQGQVGDCTLMASLAEVAARMPGAIENMFIYDGYYNGTEVWTVRLFENGMPTYVTVNSELPSQGAHVVGGGLWAPLAEKAIAEANASGWLQTAAPYAGDSYAAINNGSPTTACAYLSAITGLNSSAWYVDSGGSQQVSASYIAQELAAGKLVVVATGSSTSVLNDDIVPDHCYAVVGYNSSSSMPFEVYNPWGVGAYTSYDGHTVYGSTFICNAAFLQANYVWWGLDSSSY